MYILLVNLILNLINGCLKSDLVEKMVRDRVDSRFKCTVINGIRNTTNHLPSCKIPMLGQYKIR
jgi:hypothetical protein